MDYTCCKNFACGCDHLIASQVSHGRSKKPAAIQFTMGHYSSQSTTCSNDYLITSKDFNSKEGDKFIIVNVALFGGKK